MTFEDWWQQHNYSEEIKETCREAYHAGVEDNFLHANRELKDRDVIINFLKKELQKKTYCRQVMKRQYRELKQKYDALLEKVNLSDTRFADFVEADKNLKAVVADFNKANEWHYVKDELPISDKDKYYFVVDKWNEPMIARFYEGVWSNYSTIEDVITWKEIELLKEIKENEL